MVNHRSDWIPVVMGVVVMKQALRWSWIPSRSLVQGNISLQAAATTPNQNGGSAATT